MLSSCPRINKVRRPGNKYLDTIIFILFGVDRDAFGANACPHDEPHLMNPTAIYTIYTYTPILKPSFCPTHQASAIKAAIRKGVSQFITAFEKRPFWG
jgi:hypothetical protein